MRLEFRVLILLGCMMACPDLGEVVSQGAEDLVGGLGLGERPGVVVPGCDPALDVVLHGLDGGIDVLSAMSGLQPAGS